MSEYPLTPKQIEDGKLLALVSYASFLTGFPLFIIPMLTRDNAFALQHAKYAGVIFIASLVSGLVILAISFATCGLGTFLIFLLFIFYIPAIQGALNALNGSMEPPMLVGDYAESLFNGVTLDPNKIDGGPPSLPPSP